MNGMLGSIGSYLISWRAKKELTSFNNDMTAMSSGVEENAKYFFNRIRGTMQVPLPEFLQTFDLPKGLFPRNSTNYEFDEITGKLTVFLPYICEVSFRDATVLRYAAVVTGTLQNGKLVDIEGLKTKAFLWVKLTSISTVGDNVFFSVGMRKSRPRQVYELTRIGIQVAEF